MFVRVKDKSTKHQFDVPEGDPRIGKAFELLESDRYPRARQPRPPKHHVPAKSARAAEQGSSDTSPASDSQAEAPAEAAETPESKPARANSRK
ncbi:MULTISPECIES: hypothetical protein [unclassified Brevibacterium]|uniref:hypothetical protein n=1 Tax=unclassified Brevibacterium TaxID=2614124 RepID=UPI001E2A1337|nr:MULTISPECIES: hypothetical protein [unclassified Brevibacterium]MCD1286485.1 hypothetical protein [Brevibacterium sp. CCUG 69071]MDK8434281.1 hypothetical protein [Brevibacterium sp. H-BE7]